MSLPKTLTDDEINSLTPVQTASSPANNTSTTIPALPATMTDSQIDNAENKNPVTDPTDPNSVNPDLLTQLGNGAAKFNDVVASLVPGKTSGEYVGAKAIQAYHYIKDKLTGSNESPNYESLGPTGLEAAGDATKAGIMLATGGMAAPEEIAASTAATAAENTLPEVAPTLGQILKDPTYNVAKASLISAGYNTADAVSKGATTSDEIIPEAATGAITAGPIAAFSEAMQPLMGNLPNWITKMALPLKDDDTIDYALANAKGFNIKSMLQNSDSAIQSYNDQVNAILSHPANVTAKPIEGIDILNSIDNQYPNSGLDPFEKMRQQLPLDAKLITRLENGSITPIEANQLRQDADEISYKNSKTAVEESSIKQGRKLAGAFGNALRAQVQAVDPTLPGIFSDFSNEVILNKALQIADNKALSLPKILGILSTVGSGAGAGGIFSGPGALLGGTAAGAATYAAEQPGVQMKVAQILNNIIGPTMSAGTQVLQKGAQFGTAPVFNGPDNSQ